MYYDEITNKKIPGSFILTNTKYESTYIEILKSFKNIITNENNTQLKVITITTDFEEGLINAVKIVFPEVRHVGCLFHYVKNLRLRMSKLGLFAKGKKEIFYELFKNLSSIPFNINDNYEVINDIFSEFKNSLNKDNEELVNLNLLNKLEKYFNKTWKKYFENNSLNYIYINKIQRSNSYIENYNKRIRDLLCKWNNFI